MLTRLYELADEQGKILIGGVDIREIPLEVLRKNVGMVLQEPFLYSRTIRENIAAANPDASLGEIRNAAKIACGDYGICRWIRDVGRRARGHIIRWTEATSCDCKDALAKSADYGI